MKYRFSNVSGFFVVVFSRRQSSQGNSSSSAAKANIVVMDPKTNTMLNGPNAPTETNMEQWIRNHPSFHIVIPSHLPTSKFYGYGAAAIASQFFASTTFTFLLHFKYSSSSFTCRTKKSFSINRHDPNRGIKVIPALKRPPIQIAANGSKVVVSSTVSLASSGAGTVAGASPPSSVDKKLAEYQSKPSGSSSIVGLAEVRVNMIILLPFKMVLPLISSE